MGSTMSFKPILPKPFNAAVFNPLFMDAMLKTNDELKKDFESTVRTWEFGAKPSFQGDTTNSGTAITTEVYTVSNIYKFVNYGTKVRHAVMTPDFLPKTSPGVIQSGSGRGHLAYVSKKVNKPGISARRFDLSIRQKQEKPWRKRMMDAIAEGIKRSGAV